MCNNLLLHIVSPMKHADNGAEEVEAVEEAHPEMHRVDPESGPTLRPV
jgi:hypothetical protein